MPKEKGKGAVIAYEEPDKKVICLVSGGKIAERFTISREDAENPDTIVEAEIKRTRAVAMKIVELQSKGMDVVYPETADGIMEVLGVTGFDGFLQGGQLRPLNEIERTEIDAAIAAIRAEIAERGGRKSAARRISSN